MLAPFFLDSIAISDSLTEKEGKRERNCKTDGRLDKKADRQEGVEQGDRFTKKRKKENVDEG